MLYLGLDQVSVRLRLSTLFFCYDIFSADSFAIFCVLVSDSIHNFWSLSAIMNMALLDVGAFKR